MAYIRKEVKKGKTYASLCENKRDAQGKLERKILHNFGNLDKIEGITEANLQRIAEQLLHLLKIPIPNHQTKELERVNYGFPLVLHHCLKTYGINNYFARLTRKHNLSYNLITPVLLMLCDRINDPISKLGSYNIQEEYYGIDEVELQHFYRSLDYLADYSDELQKHIYNKNRNLFNTKLDVVFFDVTTFYFDSDVVKKDELRQLGFGKDGKIGKTQIVFSLLIDKNKMPIGFEIFDGKKFEGHTFECAVKKLKEKYHIGKVIVVADSGMMSKKNIDLFKTEGTAEQYDYIVGERLKSLPQAIKNQLITKANYTQTIETEKGNPLKICMLQHEGKTIIGTWSAKRAAKDKNDREDKLTKAKTLLNNPSQLKKKPRNYYLKTTDEITYEIDNQRAEEDALYDGHKAIATNTSTVGIETILDHYTNLYKIEHSFRTFKSFLETRPMFHWTDNRIKGHLVVCYIAFVFIRYIQEKTALTENELRKTLSQMQFSKVQTHQETLWMRSAETTNTKTIIEKLKLKKIPDTSSDKNINNYIQTFL